MATSKVRRSFAKKITLSTLSSGLLRILPGILPGIFPSFIREIKKLDQVRI